MVPGDRSLVPHGVEQGRKKSREDLSHLGTREPPLASPEPPASEQEKGPSKSLKLSSSCVGLFTPYISGLHALEYQATVSEMPREKERPVAELKRGHLVPAASG